MVYAPAAIDLSTIDAPSVLEALSFSDLFTDFKDRFLVFWAEAQALDDSLPDYDLESLETDPAMLVGRAFSYLRLLDRARVNDAIKALLAPYSTGTNLDNLVAGRNITRLTIAEATETSDAVMESDANLVRRFLLSFDAPASGSRGRYLFDAWTAWPAMGDARINGFDEHGRRGDVDVVICGVNGATPTDEEKTSVSAAIKDDNRRPEGVSIAILEAQQLPFDVDLTITVPSEGADPEVIVEAAKARVSNAALARAIVGGQIPPGLLAGAAYGDNVIAVTDNNPVVIAPDGYSVPYLGTITIGYEVAS